MVPRELKDLKDVLDANGDTIFPSELSIKLAKLAKEVDSNIQIYTDIVNKLIKECVERKEDGTPVDIAEDGTLALIPDKVPLWHERIDELEKTNFAISTIITQDELEQLKITPKQAQTLMKITETRSD